MDLRDKIRIIENFPIEGISFKDITTLLADPRAFRYAVDRLAEELKDYEFDAIVGPEARGFIIGAPLAYKLGLPFIPIRKKGKLPYKTISFNFKLEYGTDTLQMHEDALKPGSKVLLVDDLLATGGTMSAILNMIEQAGSKVLAAAFIIELDGLNAREKLGELPVVSLVHYDK